MESPSQFPPRGPALPECPRTADTAGPAFDYFFNTRNVVFARHLETIGKNVTRGGQSITLFVHNHTHFGDRSGTNALYFPLVPLGFSPARKAITPVVVNGGAWQRTTTPLELERMKAQRGVPFQDLLRSIQPEQLAPCYGFVHIAPYKERPVPTMHY